jgi:ADP-ribose pyrophosphatase YjhB (NUDIX family)
MAGRTFRCVGAVVHDELGRLLLVRRANPPGQGLWSIPGGRVEPGEDDRTAVVREVAEETGLAVEPEQLVGSVLRDAPDGDVYAVEDYCCRVTGGVPVAGDDASDVGWFTTAQLAGARTTPGLVEALTEWDVLPRI